MSWVTIDPPPGVFRNGTRYEAKGRWYDAALVRWQEGVLQPIGGWRKIQAGGVDIDVTDPILGLLAWKDNSGSSYLIYGTKDKAYAFSEDTNTDITPAAGFTAGNSDATTATLYGSGTYGTGIYGSGDPAIESVVEAQSWQFDTFGQLPVALAYSDGSIWDWDLNVANNLVVVANAPTNNQGIVVTPERFLVALGAGGDPRKVEWSDQEDHETWTPASSNQAGGTPLQSEGVLLTGRRGNGETLIWSTTDLWAMRYIGGTGVYRVDRKGSNCGAISRRAMADVEGRHFWMGPRGFFVYDGFVQEIPSEVGDYVFSDINRFQASKIHAVARSQFSEIRWYYCSNASDTINRMVAFNYAEGTWAIDTLLRRTAGIDRGVFQYPIEADANGALYDHERGTAKVDIDDSTALVPYAETGPFELGNGERRVLVRQVIPDENTLGSVTAILKARDWPTDTERTSGSITLANPTSVDIAGRTVRLRVVESGTDWRVGKMRLDVVPLGMY